MIGVFTKFVVDDAVVDVVVVVVERQALPLLLSSLITYWLDLLLEATYELE